MGTDGTSENLFYWNESVGYFAGLGAIIEFDLGLVQDFNFDHEADTRKPLSGQNSSEIKVSQSEISGGTRLAERGYVEFYYNVKSEEFINKKFSEREHGIRLSYLF